MDAKLEMFNQLIMVALEISTMSGESYEPYAEEILEALVCRREQYAHYLSFLNCLFIFLCGLLTSHTNGPPLKLPKWT
jgi:hypothetical protein